ncbi:MAG: DMT family transporter [Novosphingobium sp.]
MQQGHASFIGIAALMIIAGIGIPLMATLNAGLGKQLASPAAATFILYVVGVVLATGVLLAAGGMPSVEKFRGIGPHFYMGAVFVVFYIVTMTWAAPRIGVGNAVFFVLLGQLVAAAAIDHYGLWGAVRSAITGKRVLGIAVMALGVYLARKPV